jgi:hypothetical protein
VALGDLGPLLLQVTMGVGLASCAGLRAFVPLLVLGLAGRFGGLPLAGDHAWLAGDPALVVFGVATLVELVADKVPLVDHLLDSAATLIKPVAGGLIMSAIVADSGPLGLTVLWIVVGGSAAGVVHLLKAHLRWVSTSSTAGLGNPVLSVVEDTGAVVGSVIAVVWPVVAGTLAVLVLVGLLLLWRRLRPRRARQSSP